MVLGLDQTDWNGRSDLNELRRMFADYFGLACRNDPQGRYRLEELRSARLLLAASPAALPLAEAAQALWGVPVCRGLPYGVRGSARLVESVSRLLEQAPSPAWSADRGRRSRPCGNSNLPSAPGQNGSSGSVCGRNAQLVWLPFFPAN